MAFATAEPRLCSSIRIVVTFLGWLLAIFSTECLHAQLRTGSGSRSMYQEPPVREVPAELNLYDDSIDETRLNAPAVMPVGNGSRQSSKASEGSVVPSSHTVSVSPAKSASSARGTTAANSAKTSMGHTSANPESHQKATVLSSKSHQEPARISSSSHQPIKLASHSSADCGCNGGGTILNSGYGNHDGCCDSGCSVPACSSRTSVGACCDSGFWTETEDGCCVSPLQALLCRLSVRAEVPLFWRKGHSTPPLVTTSPLGTASDVAGQLGLGTTQILQDGVFGQDVHAGLRVTLGTYLDPCQNYGLLFRYWNAGTRNDRNVYDSNDFPILARPFRNTTVAATPANDTQLISFPGDSIGNVTVSGRSQLYGLDLSLRQMLYADRFTRVDWLYGYQHTLIGERLSIGSETTVIGNIPPLQGSTISVLDRFQTESSFHGATIGLLSTRRVACFQFEKLFRLGFGNLRRELQVAGSTTTTSGGTSNTEAQGLLARATNSRSIIDDTFVIAPEVGINLAYAMSQNIDFTIGYNYMMIPKVLQASRLIDQDLRVNLSDPLTGALDPALRPQEGRYWVRTLGLGLQFRY